MKVLAICGSLRQQSTNLGLLKYAQANAPEGMTIEIADIKDLPFYNADITETPAAVQKFYEACEQADAFLLASPEYNYSVGPAIKNALDWASKAPENKLLPGKKAALLGSGGRMGTARVQYHMRQICVYLDIHVMNKPEVFVNAFESFDEQANLTDERIQKQVDKLLQSFQAFAS